MQQFRSEACEEMMMKARKKDQERNSKQCNEASEEMTMEAREKHRFRSEASKEVKMETKSKHGHMMGILSSILAYKHFSFNDVAYGSYSYDANIIITS